jgi:nitrogen regulatory protein P-II 1
MTMKKIEAFIKPFKLNEVKMALAAAQVHAFHIFDAQELSNHQTYTDVYRGTEYQMDHNPRTMLIVYTEDEEVDAIIDSIQQAGQTDNPGDGRIAVSPVDRMIRVDAGELEPQ